MMYCFRVKQHKNSFYYKTLAALHQERLERERERLHSASTGSGDLWRSDVRVDCLETRSLDEGCVVIARSGPPSFANVVYASTRYYFVSP